MFDLDEWLLALLAVAVILGAWSVWRVRGSRDPRRAAWGRRVYVAALSLLGGGTLVAATCAARCLVPFGLASGWLVIAMLWENPFRVWQEG
ncbi:MAG TPA: hypothetical protein VKA46_32190 [Gemmataceae bacterium]|nr:hypothetical protein [Gemmataceae bacterium]